MTKPLAEPAPPRPRATRRVDAIAQLTGQRDLWVATCVPGPDGALPQPYLVPLSFAWHDERIVLAITPTSRTARGLDATGHARLGLGGTRDVVMLDVTRVAVLPVADAPHRLRAAFAQQTGWNVAETGGDYVFVVLSPERIQAWRESNELDGRTLMSHGEWRA